jgi:hypothetical protein
MFKRRVGRRVRLLKVIVVIAHFLPSVPVYQAGMAAGTIMFFGLVGRLSPLEILPALEQALLARGLIVRGVRRVGQHVLLRAHSHSHLVITSQ